MAGTATAKSAELFEKYKADYVRGLREGVATYRPASRDLFGDDNLADTKDTIETERRRAVSVSHFLEHANYINALTFENIVGETTYSETWKKFDYIYSADIREAFDGAMQIFRYSKLMEFPAQIEKWRFIAAAVNARYDLGWDDTDRIAGCIAVATFNALMRLTRFT